MEGNPYGQVGREKNSLPFQMYPHKKFGQSVLNFGGKKVGRRIENCNAKLAAADSQNWF